MQPVEDTIAAISTPLGRGGLGIIRISGNQALSIAKKVFRPNSIPFQKLKPTQATLGKVIEPRNHRDVDQALLTYFKRPKSYTREDVVEISCHGSPPLLYHILEMVLQAGARLAEPGEFTYRAFLHGRIDLVQAEAINDLINAKTHYQAELAYQQLQGKLSLRLQSLDQKFLNLIARAEASIDFADEDYLFIAPQEMERNLKELIDELSRLEQSYTQGRVLREGISMAIVGSPNVGKSSLFNHFLEQERAIVTHLPGTTRDIIIESVNIEGIPINFIDTAGMRQPSDLIEKEGVRRSRQAIREADVIIAMVDNSRPLTQEDIMIIDEIREKNFLLVINKIDLPVKIDFRKPPPSVTNHRTVRISVKTGEGLPQLKEKISTSILQGDLPESDGPLLTNLRHKEIISRCLSSTTQARSSFQQGLSEEFILLDLKQAYQKLGEITGRTSVDDVLNHIFANFCIGK